MASINGLIFMTTHHFISGIPRSGSTLLSALLKQNPRFHAAMTSPVYSIINEMLVAISAKNNYSVFISQLQKERLLRGVFDAYYSVMPEKEVIFDTRRSWTSKLPLLVNLFPECRIICCVRNVADVVNSFEYLHSKNFTELSGLYSFKSEQNLFDRTEILMRPDGHIGKTLNCLNEAMNSTHANRLLIVRYESLTNAPLPTLSEIYDFLDEPVFIHDIHNIAYEADEYDAAIGVPGLHIVRSSVSHMEKKSILPISLIKRLESFNIWQQPECNPQRVKVI